MGRLERRATAVAGRQATTRCVVRGLTSGMNGGYGRLLSAVLVATDASVTLAVSRGLARTTEHRTFDAATLLSIRQSMEGSSFWAGLSASHGADPRLAGTAALSIQVRGGNIVLFVPAADRAAARRVLIGVSALIAGRDAFGSPVEALRWSPARQPTPLAITGWTHRW